MKDYFEAGVGCGAFFTALLAGLLWLFFAGITDKYWKENTVKHGAAEWVLNPANGTTTWRWKESK